jgi:hypothetical protein
MYAEIDLSTLEKIVRKVPNISDITRDGNLTDGHKWVKT